MNIEPTMVRAGKTFYALCLSATVTAWAMADDYPMGHLTVTNYDASRATNIPVEIYYPATTAGEGTPVSPAPAGGFPVVIFAHGRQMPLHVYSNFWAKLPPRGYVTACPNTVTGSFSNPLTTYWQWQLALDVTHTALWLQQQNTNSESPFYSAISSRTAMLGHSFGGGAAILAATSDVATAVAIFASHVAVTSLLDMVHVPVVIFGGSEDHETPMTNQIGYYDRVRSDSKTVVDIIGGTHCKFADYTYECDELLEEGGTNGIPRAEQQSTTTLFLHPWLDATLKQSAAARTQWEHLLRNSGLVTFRHWYPLDEKPVLEITPSTNVPGLDLRWLSATARVFQCQVATRLLSPSWTNRDAAVTGNAGLGLLSYPWTNWSPGAFFRLDITTNLP